MGFGKNNSEERFVLHETNVLYRTIVYVYAIWNHWIIVFNKNFNERKDVLNLRKVFFLFGYQIHFTNDIPFCYSSGPMQDHAKWTLLQQWRVYPNWSDKWLYVQLRWRMGPTKLYQFTWVYDTTNSPVLNFWWVPIWAFLSQSWLPSYHQMPTCTTFCYVCFPR